MSGQCINLAKSFFTFSPNVGYEEKGRIIQGLRLENYAPHDSYLGLPRVVGRNKKKFFASIKEQVWKQIQEWRRNLFLASDTEVLIKLVLHAIPSYLMSRFKVPASLCDEL